MSEVNSLKSSRLSFLYQEEFDALIVHFLFGILCVIVLILPVDIPFGLRMMTLVVSYVIGIPVIGLTRGYSEWTFIWFFSVILSLFQIFPDWFLSEQLNILIFPEEEFLKIGTVSLYMALLWTIPVFIIIFVGVRSQFRTSNKVAYIIIAIVSLIIFALSELFLYSSWHAQDVLMISNIAVYIIVPEILFGISSFWIYQQVRKQGIFKNTLGAATVMIFYLGSAAFFYFLIEKIILPLF